MLQPLQKAAGLKPVILCRRSLARPSRSASPGLSLIHEADSVLFDAYLKCPTKCYLRSTGRIGSGNEYAEWARETNEAYQRKAALRLAEALAEHERADTALGDANLKNATWRLEFTSSVVATHSRARR
jgi:hypothetical protein